MAYRAVSVSNVPPAFAPFDARHLLVGDAILLGYLVAGARIFAYGANLIIRQFGAFVANTTTLDMHPSASRLNGGYRRPANSIIWGYFFRCARVCYNLGHLFAGQLISTAAFLAGHVERIVFPRSTKQMSRVAARRVITVMADAVTGGYRPDADFVHQAVRSPHAVVDAERPITTGSETSCPRPACIWPAASVDQFYKSLVHEHPLSQHRGFANGL